MDKKKKDKKKKNQKLSSLFRNNHFIFQTFSFIYNIFEPLIIFIYKF